MINLSIKKVVACFFILLLSSCSGCDHCDDQPVIYNYSIQNNSGAKVEIIPYSSNSSGVEAMVLSEKITIEDSKSVSKEFKDLAPYDGFSFNDFLKYPSKIDIVFNNSKKITYEICGFNGVFCNSPRNIFNHEFNNEINEIYKITASDFQNATNCNGNCY
ncbi:hypothetical protein [uncultured Chryseobacterium sp.]|uniref:hypothetical protein n=1 Tax=uncultured Chryseobacterium sp. TaxID=259322 RepID=UPI0025ED44A2|nr:hypothetical protein [uncultured Chryseobacterium sp.]